MGEADDHTKEERRAQREADREERLNSILNSEQVASRVISALRADRVKRIEPQELPRLLHRDPEPGMFMGTLFPEQQIDPQKLFAFLSKLICPPVCVGFVNSTGWHQVCEKKAQMAMRELGIVPPELTPIPADDLS